jgi:hypothetical protein
MNSEMKMVNYRIPNPLQSYEQSLKFDHFDLTELDDLTLWREQKKVEIAIALSFPASSSARTWLIERLEAVRRESSRRKDSFRGARRGLPPCGR